MWSEADGDYSRRDAGEDQFASDGASDDDYTSVCSSINDDQAPNTPGNKRARYSAQAESTILKPIDRALPDARDDHEGSSSDSDSQISTPLSQSFDYDTPEPADSAPAAAAAAPSSASNRRVLIPAVSAIGNALAVTPTVAAAAAKMGPRIADPAVLGRHSWALVCACNMNRSMAAHALMNARGFPESRVYSYGASDAVRLPGRMGPVPFEFGVSYSHILSSMGAGCHNAQWLIDVGLMPMLQRNAAVKSAPESWFSHLTDAAAREIDFVLCFDVRVYDVVVADLVRRGSKFKLSAGEGGSSTMGASSGDAHRSTASSSAAAAAADPLTGSDSDAASADGDDDEFSDPTSSALSSAPLPASSIIPLSESRIESCGSVSNTDDGGNLQLRTHSRGDADAAGAAIASISPGVSYAIAGRAADGDKAVVPHAPSSSLSGLTEPERTLTSAQVQLGSDASSSRPSPSRARAGNRSWHVLLISTPDNLQDAETAAEHAARFAETVSAASSFETASGGGGSGLQDWHESDASSYEPEGSGDDGASVCGSASSPGFGQGSRSSSSSKSAAAGVLLTALEVQAAVARALGDLRSAVGTAAIKYVALPR